MYEEIKIKLQKALPKRRYIHSLGVADEGKRLAALYGADSDKAYLAGLLHDCAKGIPTDEQIKECDKRGVEIDEWTRKCPQVAHGFLGVEIAKSEYGISDDEILSAIKYHTVGSREMTLLDKIIYIADMTEVNRDFDGVDELRKAVDKDLDEAILISIEQSFIRQQQRRGIIHPNVIYMWNDLIRS